MTSFSVWKTYNYQFSKGVLKSLPSTERRPELRFITMRFLIGMGKKIYMSLFIFSKKFAENYFHLKFLKWWILLNRNGLLCCHLWIKPNNVFCWKLNLISVDNKKRFRVKTKIDFRWRPKLILGDNKKWFLDDTKKWFWLKTENDFSWHQKTNWGENKICSVMKTRNVFCWKLKSFCVDSKKWILVKTKKHIQSKSFIIFCWERRMIFCQEQKIITVGCLKQKRKSQNRHRKKREREETLSQNKVKAATESWKEGFRCYRAA